MPSAVEELGMQLSALAIGAEKSATSIVASLGNITSAAVAAKGAVSSVQSSLPAPTDATAGIELDTRGGSQGPHSLGVDILAQIKAATR